jgi:ankyrin repeat protein
MKHKDDIYYSKPKKFISEYFAGILVVAVAALFLIFEFFSFSASENNATASNTQKTVQECNSSGPTVALDELVKPKELLPVKGVDTLPKKELKRAKESETQPIEKQEAKTAKAKQEIKTKQTSNPIVDILQMRDESAIWKLQQSYTNYSQEDKQKLLHHAVNNNHVENLEKMLDRGYTFGTHYYEGNTNQLIFKRKYQVVILMIERGIIDVHQKNKYGYTLLHEASAKGHSGLIRLLVSKGVDINSRSRSGASALHYPTRYGYSITVGVLLELGIDPNLKATLNYGAISWNGTTPLHIAIRRGHKKVFKKLLDNGADPLVEDDNGMNALAIAKQVKNSYALSLLEPTQKTTAQDDNSTQAEGVEESESSDDTIDESTDTKTEEITTQESNQTEPSAIISDGNSTQNGFE